MSDVAAREGEVADALVAGMRSGPSSAVPFCVATQGALADARSRAGEGAGGGEAN